MANEKRLIDANALFELLKEQRNKETGAYSKGRNNGINIAIGAIKNEQICPTVDALIPPVKPWDKVWIVCKTLDLENGGLKKTICEGEIFKLSYNGFTIPMEWIDYRYDSPMVGQTTSHDRIDLCLGKTVFLNREEAEAALAKMDGDGNA